MGGDEGREPGSWKKKRSAESWRQYSARCIGLFSQSDWFGASKRGDGYQQSSAHEIHEAVVMIQQDNDAEMRTLQGGRVRTVRRKGFVS
jgi:hypothetical protein